MSQFKWKKLPTNYLQHTSIQSHSEALEYSTNAHILILPVKTEWLNRNGRVLEVRNCPGSITYKYVTLYKFLDFFELFSSSMKN